MKGNKGEWSEIYTLFKLLGDGVVYAGNGDMEKIDDLFYPIMRVIRREAETYNYEPRINDNRVVVILNDIGDELMRVSMADFASMAKSLLDSIKTARGSAFALPHIEEFMHSVNCHTLKARSIDKTDIRIVIHDLRTGTTPTLGFSIKSQLGNPSTLLNSGMTTNFKYRIEGLNLTDEEIADINAIKGQNDRMRDVFLRGGRLKYHSMDCQTFEDNLIIIDSFMPEIIAECIAEHFISGSNNLSELTEGVINRNPLGIRRNPELYYMTKIKSLLVDVALGMTPAKVWNRRYDANGGYLVVRNDGEVLCYHFYDRNQIEDYLYQNTRFDYPSRERYHYGSLFREGNEIFIKLNFQIRFK